MNTILQKRIEEARKNYENSLSLPEWDRKEIHGIDFMKGATFALQNQWISVEEALPDYDEVVMVIDGTDEDNLPVTIHRSPNKNDVIQDSHEFCLQWIGQKITHWMFIPQLKGGKE